MNKPTSDQHFVTSVDPFSAASGGFFISLFRAVLATALFRCWHVILFFTLWAAAVSLISDQVHNLAISPTLLTVLGTVLGFVISYRTSSSFERYNEGRRLWASVILSSRTMARFVWFHVPDTWAAGPGESLNKDEQKARTLVEKKTTINLIEAFAVSLKHYLRGEEGIYYEDLYHLVKFLPGYAMPAGLAPVPTPVREEEELLSPTSETQPTPSELEAQVPSTLAQRRGQTGPAIPRVSLSNSEKTAQQLDEPDLKPSRNPPKSSIFDVWPLSLIGKQLSKKGKDVKGKKSARERARRRVVSHNIPLELTLYLSAYISSLQVRKHCDVPTINSLIASLNLLADSLTGLERVLTTPIPFSYSIHLWSVTCIYCFALPFQLWSALKWITIPATFVASFVFFGFLAAGEEIENPFGYDKNDLNLDHFTHNIIHQELQSLTSRPMPDISVWAFHTHNDHIFGKEFAGTSPEEWVDRGVGGMRKVMEAQETMPPPTPQSAVRKSG